MEAVTIRSHSLTRSLSLVQTAHAPMCLCACCLGRRRRARGEIATFLFQSVCLSLALSFLLAQYLYLGQTKLQPAVALPSELGFETLRIGLVNFVLVN